MMQVDANCFLCLREIYILVAKLRLCSVKGRCKIVVSSAVFMVDGFKMQALLALRVVSRIWHLASRVLGFLEFFLSHFRLNFFWSLLEFKLLNGVCRVHQIFGTHILQAVISRFSREGRLGQGNVCPTSRDIC